MNEHWARAVEAVWRAMGHEEPPAERILNSIDGHLRAALPHLVEAVRAHAFCKCADCPDLRASAERLVKGAWRGPASS